MNTIIQAYEWIMIYETFCEWGLYTYNDYVSFQAFYVGHLLANWSLLCCILQTENFYF